MTSPGAARSFVGVLAAILLSVDPAPAAAQPWFDVAAGAAVPLGPYQGTRRTGPAVRGTVTCCQRHKHVTVRGELEGVAMFGGPLRRPTAPNERGNAYAVSALASYVVGVPDSRRGPYLFLGLGAAAVVVPTEDRLMSVAPAGRVGVGARGELWGTAVHFEIASHLAASGHGLVADYFGAVQYMPIVFGISF